MLYDSPAGKILAEQAQRPGLDLLSLNKNWALAWWMTPTIHAVERWKQ